MCCHHQGVHTPTSNLLNYMFVYIYQCWSQWPCGLRSRSSAARLLQSWVRIPLGAWMFVYCECCVLSGRDLCDGLITRPEESYQLWRVVVCDQEASNTRRLKPATGLWKIQPRWVVTQGKQTTNKQTYIYRCCNDIEKRSEPYFMTLYFDLTAKTKMTYI
jgi:hypothetical protein